MRKLNTEQFIEKANCIHKNKYNYNLTCYINNSTKVVIKCPIHGEFNQTPNNHLDGKGCPECSNNKKLSNVSFIQKAIKIHGNRYNYKKINIVNNKQKVIITCPKHGDFEQQPDNHLQGQGCPICKSINLSLKNNSNTEQFIEKAKSIHGDRYDYSKVIYINAIKSIYITCKKHGVFEQIPSTHLKGSGCPICKASKGELAIKAILDKHNITVEPQYRLPDEKYLFKYDFYLTELNILIEFHGIQHYEWIPYFHKTYGDFQEQQRRDIHKIDLAKMKNIPLLEFNYKQLKHMSQEQFEQMVLSKVTCSYSVKDMITKFSIH